MNLITLEEAKAHLLVDHDDVDSDIVRKLQVASATELTYLDGAPIGQPKRDEQGAILRTPEGEVDYLRDGDELVDRHEVKAAGRLLLGELYKHRVAEPDGA